MNDYIAKIKLFSRNARLYVLHVIFMDLIHGTWAVIFNLYLLAVGLPIEFVGLRILVGGVVGAVSAVPAGALSDRIGRKAGFILGDGLGAVMAVASIMTMNRPLLLLTAAGSGFFGALHHVSEPPFMHENSEAEERVHLFSVAASLRTASAMIGSIIAAVVPLWFAASFGKVAAYRGAALAGIGLWFFSLAPALLLREQREPDPGRQRGIRGFLSGVEHPGLIAKLVVPTALFALGAGFVLPLGNVFFHEGMHAHEGHIGATFAIAQGVVAIAALAAPLVTARMSKVRAVTLVRTLSLPFVVVLVIAAGGGDTGWALVLASAAWVGRSSFQGMASPIDDAFSMEIMSKRERATSAGFEAAAFQAMIAAGGFVGARLMSGGDFTSSFFLMGAAHVWGIALFWRFFRSYDSAPREAPDGAVEHRGDAVAVEG